jgi:uncharacterized repeat protein (TIGR03806 family)
MNKIAILLITLIFQLLPAATPPITTQEIVSGGLRSPVGVTYRPGDTEHLFVIEQHTGRVLMVQLATGAIGPTPFLTEVDITLGMEQGLLGIAFHPNYASNGWVFINCTKPGPGWGGHTEIVRYTATAPYSTATSVDQASRVVVMQFDQPEYNHNGGWIGFGKDGYLYIASGDGGGGGDQHGTVGNGQDLNTKLGKILRINVATQPPTYPTGNMTGAGVDPAIFAFGLRNPWRCSIDRENGNLWIGDVGQYAREEVSYGPFGVGGRNYGWRRHEGFADFDLTTPLAKGSTHAEPVVDYSHAFGSVVIGGYVYRGRAIPELVGSYIYCDFYARWFSMFTAGAGKPTDQQDITHLLNPSNRIFSVSSFGEDANGEIYMCDYNHGSLHKIVPFTVPDRLSFMVQPTNTLYGDLIYPSIKVALQDASGKTLSTSNAIVALRMGQNSTGAVLSGGKSVNAINGIAEFNYLSLDKYGVGYTLIASCGGVEKTSLPFDINTQVPAPTFTPPGGVYTGPITVALGANKPTSASIYYTTDGTNPDKSSYEYNGPFTVTSNTLVHARAIKHGVGESSVTAAFYEIIGTTPYGIQSRKSIWPYLYMPKNANGVMPESLAGTGAFDSINSLKPTDGIIPYEVNAPFWSDGAIKRRWISLPSDGMPFDVNETIGFSATGEWTFPAGSVFIKHFDLAIDERTPEVRRRIETRLLVRTETGAYGVTYRWNEDQNDARVVTSGQSANYLITTSTGGTRNQTWYFPSPQDCLRCHTANAGYVLGVNTRQLNGNCNYPNDVRDNQLRAWNTVGMFNIFFNESEIGTFEHLFPLTDTSATLEQRARSYLDSNCAQCHRPGGAPAAFDARHVTSLSRQGIINGNVVNNLGIEGAKVIVPRDTSRSILYQRMHTLDAKVMMPPLGRAMVDQKGVELIGKWIGSMSEPTVPPGNVSSSGNSCGSGSLAAWVIGLFLLALGYRRLR